MQDKTAINADLARASGVRAFTGDALELRLRMADVRRMTSVREIRATGNHLAAQNDEPEPPAILRPVDALHCPVTFTAEQLCSAYGSLVAMKDGQ